ncbi:MAG: hypothetical protein GY861_12790 [bacterium]|nr:hypothetical protein [bacterium]
MTRQEIENKVISNLQENLNSWGRGETTFNLESSFVDDLGYDDGSLIEFEGDVLGDFNLSQDLIDDTALDKVVKVFDLVDYVEGILK